MELARKSRDLVCRRWPVRDLKCLEFPLCILLLCDVALTTARDIPNDEEESLENFNNFFYHQRFYSTFTNKTFISRAQRCSEKAAKTLTETVLGDAG